MPMFVERYIASIDKSHTCRHYYFIGIRYVAPTIVNTFLESHDFSGKRIVLFATSGGSKFGNTVEELKVSVADDVEIIEGKLLNGRQSIASVKAWTDSLDV